MKNIARSIELILIGSLIVIMNSGIASAVSDHPDSVYTQASKHEGVAGCIAWSWSDGNVTTNVYYHNRCNDAHVLEIFWDKPTGMYHEDIRVAADANGNTGHELGVPVSISQKS